MHDQAQKLRSLVDRHKQSNKHVPATTSTRIIAVTSGKGGVGKSNVSLNFAICLASHGKKVILLDADLGFANIDILMGAMPKKTLEDLVKFRASIWDVLQLGPNGIQYIAGGSGLYDLVDLNEDQIRYVIDQLALLQGYADIIIIDMGAGLNEQSLRMIMSADDIIVVSTPEPTAITDAYALIKLIKNRHQSANLQLIVNRATNAAEGKETAEKLSKVGIKFLGVDLKFLGMIFDDPLVSKAVKEQIPFTIRYPDTTASRCIQDLVRSYLHLETSFHNESSGVRTFLDRLMDVLRK